MVKVCLPLYQVRLSVISMMSWSRPLAPEYCSVPAVKLVAAAHGDVDLREQRVAGGAVVADGGVVQGQFVEQVVAQGAVELGDGGVGLVVQLVIDVSEGEDVAEALDGVLSEEPRHVVVAQGQAVLVADVVVEAHEELGVVGDHVLVAVAVAARIVAVLVLHDADEAVGVGLGDAGAAEVVGVAAVVDDVGGRASCCRPFRRSGRRTACP